MNAPGTLIVTAQLSLLPEIPERIFVRRRCGPKSPSAVERALINLAPSLPSNMLPTFHRGCVEIAVPKHHHVERLLRRVGFRVNRHPFGWVKPPKVKRTRKTKAWKQTAIAQAEVVLRYWRLEYAR